MTPQGKIKNSHSRSLSNGRLGTTSTRYSTLGNVKCSTVLENKNLQLNNTERQYSNVKLLRSVTKKDNRDLKAHSVQVSTKRATVKELQCCFAGLHPQCHGRFSFVDYFLGSHVQWRQGKFILSSIWFAFIVFLSILHSFLSCVCFCPPGSAGGDVVTDDDDTSFFSAVKPTTGKMTLHICKKITSVYYQYIQMK